MAAAVVAATRDSRAWTLVVGHALGKIVDDEAEGRAGVQAAVALAAVSRATRHAVRGDPDAVAAFLVDAVDARVGSSHRINDADDDRRRQPIVRSAIAFAYLHAPELLSVECLRQLLQPPHNVVLPRVLVLLFAREKEAMRTHSEQVAAHVRYRQQVHDRILQRSTEDTTFRDLLPVPPPQPLPQTPTSRLPNGTRDAIIMAGIEMYGRVFPPYPPPPTTPEERLPDSLRWLATRIPQSDTNPAYIWPPDDSLFFAFLMRFACQTIMPPKESWSKVCKGIREIINWYGFELALVIGPLSQFLFEHYKSDNALLSDLFNGFGNASIGAAGEFGGNASGKGSKDRDDAGKHAWLVGEMFQYDNQLAHFLARCGGIPEGLIVEEKCYWTLISSNIHIPPNKYSPLLPATEKLIVNSLSSLPSPIPTGTLRRILLNHPSKSLLTRLAPFVPRERLVEIGEDILENLLTEPSNYGGLALKSADGLIAALEISLDTVAQIFLTTAPINEASTPLVVGNVSFSRRQSSSVLPDPECADSEAEPPLPIETPSLTFSAPGETTTAMLTGDIFAVFHTRQARKTGTIQWTHWKWALTRFPPTHRVPRSCLHDLVLRESLSELQSDERRIAFADKEADRAVLEVLGSGVRPTVGTFKGIVSRVLRDARRREEGWEFAGGSDGGVFPARFVFVMARIERDVLDTRAADEAQSKQEAPPRSVVSERQVVSSLSVRVEQRDDNEVSTRKEWVDVLRSHVTENAAWKAIVMQHAPEVSMPDPPEIRFYWACLRLVDDYLASKGRVGVVDGENPRTRGLLFAAWQDECALDGRLKDEVLQRRGRSGSAPINNGGKPSPSVTAHSRVASADSLGPQSPVAGGPPSSVKLDPAEEEGKSNWEIAMMRSAKRREAREAAAKKAAA